MQRLSEIAELLQVVARVRRAAHRQVGSLRILILIALTMGASGEFQSLVAQRAQPTILTYYIDFGSARTSICIGETVNIPVRVRARVLVPGSPDAGSLPYVLSASLTATVGDRGVLRDATTSQRAGLLFPDVPLSTTYSFTGVSAGRTSIGFAGEVLTTANVGAAMTAFPVVDDLRVRVIPCRLRVISNARWSQRLIGGSITAYAVVMDGELTGDQEGYLTGTARVVWLLYAAIPGCGQTNTLKYGTVNMRGRIDQDNHVVVDMTYPPMGGSEMVNCPGVGSGGGSIFANASPLRATVSGYGGVVTLEQSLSGSAGVISGRSTVYIAPIAQR